jgi:XRE family aerobic/anaerobic benzoate catabolism transcriptional regulator
VKKKMRKTATLRAKAPARSRNDPFLGQLGERTRRLRARSGLTRRELAKEADVSERHLANLETGVGNPSVQILRQVAHALNCSVAELVGDEGDESADWLLIRDLLRSRSAEELADARRALTDHFGLTGSSGRRQDRIALIGLRGAGKSTLGRMLAEHLHYPFVEVNREVERLAAPSLGIIIYRPPAKSEPPQ